MITPNLLKSMSPATPANQLPVIAEKLNNGAVKFEINTPLRVLHWLAQLAHESGFMPIEENLNYSATRLLQVFPKYFPSMAVANAYARNPAAIGSRVYANRMGNGSEASREGYAYRGRGYLQLTGKNNYSRYGRLIGYDLVNEPDLCLQHGISALVAGAYFKENGLLALADKNNINAITLRVNGGYNGLPDRRARLVAGAKHLGVRL